MSLLGHLGRDLYEQLTRLSIQECSTWAEKTRVMGKPFPGLWTFDRHPWTREMHDCWAERMIGQKAAQMGYTETALNKTLYAIDVKKESVLYILPARVPNAANFSSSRFDPALELSPHLARLFTSVKNVGHKRAGPANLFIRGSRSKADLKSDPTGIMIFDEVEEMVQNNIPLAFERMSGQENQHAFLLSTPSFEDFGINKYFKTSNQKEWFFNCPFCSKFTNLTYSDDERESCLIIVGENWYDKRIRESHYVCKECRHVLPQEGKMDYISQGEWVPKNDSVIEGYHISQMYSFTVNPWQLAESRLKGHTNQADEQEFFNSKLGLPHSPAGSQILDTHLDSCRGNYSQFSSVDSGLITMGVDVGKKIHYEINQWFIDAKGTTDINLSAQPRVIKEGFVREFEELDTLMNKFKIIKCVIDRQPETRKAREFAERFKGRVTLCIYNQGIHGRELKENKKARVSEVGADRTSWLDVALSRFINRRIAIPKDVCPEYYPHIKALKRIVRPDANGNPTAKYIADGEKPDHLAHCRVYNEIALRLATSGGTNESLMTVL